MAIRTDKAVITVALVGNPNTGKSTLFSALVGVRQRVGNYPGVTVEKTVGRMAVDGARFDVIDLPGTYSLAPRSLDEAIAVDVLLGRQRDVGSPAVVVCIVDASNLHRNLYLLSQVLEFQVPTVVALNKTDLAAEIGIQIDATRLQEQIGVPVIETQAHRGVGVDALRRAIHEAATGVPPQSAAPFPEPFQREVDALAEHLARAAGTPLPRYLVERLLLDTNGFLAGRYLQPSRLGDAATSTLHQIDEARQRLAKAGHPVPAVETRSRYGWVDRVLDGVIVRSPQRPVTVTDRLDRILMHRWLGTIVFVLIMAVMFQAVFTWAEPAMELIEDGFAALGDWLGAAVALRLGEGAIESLLRDGVVGGVGAVVVFLPQILILFFFIAVLEDCGYMARAAYLMDGMLARVGLSGKSFIPLLSSFACAIPGVMATRVIEDRQSRLATIFIAPLMSCSARLPVYILLIAALVPDKSWLFGLVTLKGATLFAMYFLGIVAAVATALLLRATLLRGRQPAAFVMELPAYKLPSLRIALLRMTERGWVFLYQAGTLIFAATVVIWAAAYYPRHESVGQPYQEQIAQREAELAGVGHQASGIPNAFAEERIAQLQEEIAELENEMAGEYLRQSYLGRAGRVIEPAVRPLGWDWRVGCAVLAAFPARELVIGTLGVLYNLGEGADENSAPLRERLRSATWDDSDRPVFTLPVAISLMVFFALCCQCAATLAVIKRETNSWRWPVFAFFYMTGLAYGAAWIAYQAGNWLFSS